MILVLILKEKVVLEAVEENNKKLLFGKWLVLEEVYVEKYKKTITIVN